jgi:membrane-bound metal-dependent hydrolase YbcI (DUF457 family)
VGASVAPDADLLLRFVDGRNHHQGPMHSLGFAALAALAGALAGRFAASPSPALALRAGLSWASHVALDWLGKDTHPPIGLMALWPVSHAWWKSAWTPFLDVGRALDAATLTHDMIAAAWEVTVLLPILIACSWRFREA